MKRAILLGCVALAAAMLAGCGEKRQTLGENSRRDTAAFQGTGMPYQVQGWKAGDRGSWEQQLKSRTQGQNDYAKVN